MKKIVLLLMAIFACALSFAQKNQYVKWGDNLPNASKEQKVEWLKKAMKGQPITNASVRSNAASYVGVWGQDLYNEILTAKTNEFAITYSKGGETNYGLTNSAEPVVSGQLSSGIEIISLNGKPVAKWGSNGCLNALLSGEVADVEDRDNTTLVRIRNNKKTSNDNDVGLNINLRTSNSNEEGELSYRKGIRIFAEGANFYADVQRETVSLLRQNPLGCCGGTQQGTPSLFTNASVSTIQQPAQVYAQTVTRVPFGQTFGGQVLANTAGEVLGTYVVRGIDNVSGRNGVYRNTTVRYGNQQASLFQNSNQQNYTGTTGSGGSWGTTGSWGNQW